MASDIYLNGTYVEKNPTYHVEDSPWKAKQILSMIDKHGLRLRTVCEIGCGAGEILSQLQAHLPEAEFFGYEISPQAFSMCRNRENDRLHFHCEDLLAAEADGFDALLCIDVFEHVEDYLGFLRALRGKSTYKIFHIPLDLTVQTVLRGRPIMQTRKKVGHLHHFTKEMALDTLLIAGYEIIDWSYTPERLDLARKFKTRLMKYPRKFLSLINADLTARILGGYSLLVLTR